MKPVSAAGILPDSGINTENGINSNNCPSIPCIISDMISSSIGDWNKLISAINSGISIAVTIFSESDRAVSFYVIDSNWYRNSRSSSVELG